MAYFDKLNLQLFADGGEGGGEGAATGAETAVDAGQQRLLELGVPADKIRKRAKRPAVTLPQGAVRTESPAEPQQPKEQAAAASSENPTEEQKPEDKPPRMSWDEIMADPEYNKQMQATVQARLRTAKASEEAMGKLAPALEVLARNYGLDPANLDYEALTKSISEDNNFYEKRAMEMGVSVESAKKIDQNERETARAQQEAARTIEQQKIQQHIQKLEQQGEAMKTAFPNFDLRRELQNPAFARMTGPNVGISVEDAYYAVHRQEIQAASMQAAAQKTAEKLSNSVQSGSRRPAENGTSGQAPSVTTFDYRTMTKEQRAALKKRIYDAAARQEKVYPGR